MSKVTFDYPAGIKVKDQITGVEGILTARCQRINGCLQYFIQPKYKDDNTEVPGHWTDGENLLVKDWMDKVEGPSPVEFAFETGDRIKNRLHNKIGFCSVRRIDMNGCIGYWYESGEVDKDGKQIERYGFEQEFALVDKGLNAPEEQPLARRATGCAAGVPK